MMGGSSPVGSMSEPLFEGLLQLLQLCANPKEAKLVIAELQQLTKQYNTAIERYTKEQVELQKIKDELAVREKAFAEDMGNQKMALAAEREELDETVRIAVQKRSDELEEWNQQLAELQHNLVTQRQEVEKAQSTCHADVEVHRRWEDQLRMREQELDQKASDAERTMSEAVARLAEADRLIQENTAAQESLKAARARLQTAMEEL